MNKDSLEQLQQRLIEFSNARHWEKFHSPKNLSMALSVEVAELLEHFQWLTEEESRKINGHKLDEVKDEVADVLLYLVQLSTALDVDLIDAAQRKMVINARKYPVVRID